MTKARLAAALAAMLLAASPVFAETLTNTQVVELSRAGLSPDAIIAKIRISDSRFDVSANAMVALKRDDVSDAVIAAMVVATAGGGGPGIATFASDSADPAAPHQPGIYVLQDGPAPRMAQLDPTLADASHAPNAIGWALSGGLIPLKITTVLNGATARLQVDTPRPTFYFYFNQPGSGLYRNGLGTMRLDAPASPEEFQLLGFKVVNGAREAQTMTLRGALSRPDGPASVAPCHYSEVAPGVFKVTPDVDLPPGEYAFDVTPASDGDDTQDRYFDFSVGPAAA
jgi:hypothetical protein